MKTTPFPSGLIIPLVDLAIEIGVDRVMHFMRHDGGALLRRHGRAHGMGDRQDFGGRHGWRRILRRGRHGKKAGGEQGACKRRMSSVCQWQSVQWLIGDHYRGSNCRARNVFAQGGGLFGAVCGFKTILRLPPQWYCDFQRGMAGPGHADGALPSVMLSRARPSPTLPVPAGADSCPRWCGRAPASRR